MHLRPTLLSVLVLALAGCGGNDHKAPVELTGKLHGGHVQGVSWHTPTHSGSTDVNGGFTYLPGETVTFSLGDVELGAAPGAPDITLFTLAGLTPPTTERTLRLQLDRAMRMSTPFTRAINIDALLIALDADGNPDNGVDVRSGAAALKGSSLNFDQGIYDFGRQLYATVPGLVQAMPGFKPVAHLYASLGLRIPVHAQRRIVTDTSGQALPGVQTVDYETDGTIRTEDTDQDADGVIDSHIGYEHDAFGRVTHTDYRVDFNLDHVIDQTYTYTAQFDARGKIISGQTSSQDLAFGQSQTWKLIENDVDEFGRVTRQVQDVDTDGDGTFDARQTGDVVYSTSPAGSAYTVTMDRGKDGIDDQVIRQIEVDDAKGRVLSQAYETDDDANGIVDSRYTITSTYDDPARTIRSVIENDADGDGMPEWRQILFSQLDRAGNVITETTTTDPMASGFPQQTETITREFDAARRMTKSTRDEDYMGNGIPESRETDTVRYDELGNVTARTGDYDANFDGQVDTHVDEGYEYGIDGELLGGAKHIDLDADGITDNRIGITVENTLVDDGVLLLTNWYFLGRASVQ